MGLSLPRSLRGGGPYAPPRQHAPEGVTSARQSAGVLSSAASPRRRVRAGTNVHALGATEARAARGAGPADTEADAASHTRRAVCDECWVSPSAAAAAPV